MTQKSPDRKYKPAHHAGLISVFVLVWQTFCGAAYADVEQLIKRPWFEYRSAHFRLFSDLPDEEASRRIRDLELFREVVFYVTQAPRFEDVVPMEFYLFERSGDLALVLGGGDTLGFMSPSLRANIMVASLGNSRFRGARIMFHEFVHYLVRGAGAPYLPAWYDEGLAEMLSTVEVRGDHIRVGEEPDERMQSLHSQTSNPFAFRLSIESVIQTVNVSDRHALARSLFYANAWALTHYLHSGHLSGGRDRRGEIRQYLQLVQQSVPAKDAFTRAFGESPGAAERAIERYVDRSRRPVLQLPLAQFPVNADYDRQPASAEEMAYRLGYVALSSNSDFSRAAFEYLLQGDSQDARALAGIAVSHQFDEEFAEGAVWAEKARAIAPDDLLVGMEQADLWMSWCRHPEKAAANCAELQRRALSLYRDIHSKDPNWLEGRFGLAAALLETEQEVDRAQELLLEIKSVAPWFNIVDVWLAMGELQEGRFDVARELALQTLYRSEDEVLTALAQRTLQAIEQRAGLNSEKKADRAGVGTGQ